MVMPMHRGVFLRSLPISDEDIEQTRALFKKAHPDIPCSDIILSHVMKSIMIDAGDISTEIGLAPLGEAHAALVRHILNSCVNHCNAADAKNHYRVTETTDNAGQLRFSLHMPTGGDAYDEYHTVYARKMGLNDAQIFESLCRKLAAGQLKAVKHRARYDNFQYVANLLALLPEAESLYGRLRSDGSLLIPPGDYKKYMHTQERVTEWVRDYNRLLRGLLHEPLSVDENGLLSISAANLANLKHFLPIHRAVNAKRNNMLPGGVCGYQYSRVEPHLEGHEILQRLFHNTEGVLLEVNNEGRKTALHCFHKTPEEVIEGLRILRPNIDSLVRRDGDTLQFFPSQLEALFKDFGSVDKELVNKGAKSAEALLETIRARNPLPEPKQKLPVPGVKVVPPTVKVTGDVDEAVDLFMEPLAMLAEPLGLAHRLANDNRDGINDKYLSSKGVCQMRFESEIEAQRVIALLQKLSGRQGRINSDRQWVDHKTQYWVSVDTTARHAITKEAGFIHEMLEDLEHQVTAGQSTAESTRTEIGEYWKNLGGGHRGAEEFRRVALGAGAERF